MISRRPYPLLLLVVATLSLARVLPAQSDVRLRKQDGSAVTGELIQLDDQEIRIRVDANEIVAMPVDDLKRIELGHKLLDSDEPCTIIHLTNNDAINVQRLECSSDLDQALCVRNEQKLTIPTAYIRELSFRSQTFQYRRPVVNADGADVAVLANGDLVTGELVQLGLEEFRIETKLGELAFQRPSVSALVLNPQLTENIPTSGPWARVYLTDGSMISGNDLQIESDSKQCSFATNWEQEIRIPLQDICRIEFWNDQQLLSGGQSHPPWASFSGEDFFGGELSAGENRSAERGYLISSGKQYATGFGVRSQSVIALNVPSNAKTFFVTVGLDNQAGRTASVDVELKLDDFTLWAGRLDRLEGSIADDVSVSVAGGKTLQLIVKFGPRADVGDLVNWCSPWFELEH